MVRHEAIAARRFSILFDFPVERCALMLHGKDYAPCTECAAKNVTGRETCWQCGQPLPYSKSAVGKIKVTRAQRVVSRSEIASLLDQAELFVCDSDQKPGEAAPSVQIPAAEPSLALRVQRWLLGERDPAKSRT